MTITLDTTRPRSLSHSYVATAPAVRRRSVLDLYGRWSVLRGAIADMETETSDDELRAFLAAEADTVREMAALQPRTLDELNGKLEAFIALVDEADVSRDLRLLAHSLSVDIRSWAATV